MSIAGRIANDPRSIIDLDSRPVRPGSPPRAFGGGSDLRSRLGDLMGEESPERLRQRLAEFRRTVRETLIATSSAYAVLDQLSQSGLRDCAKCTREIEARLANNPHYIVLEKLEEAERRLAELGYAAR